MFGSIHQFILTGGDKRVSSFHTSIFHIWTTAGLIEILSEEELCKSGNNEVLMQLVYVRCAYTHETLQFYVHDKKRNSAQFPHLLVLISLLRFECVRTYREWVGSCISCSTEWQLMNKRAYFQQCEIEHFLVWSVEGCKQRVPQTDTLDVVQWIRSEWRHLLSYNAAKWMHLNAQWCVIFTLTLS